MAYAMFKFVANIGITKTLGGGMKISFLHMLFVLLFSISSFSQSNRLPLEESFKGKAKFQTNLELDYSLQKNDAGNEVNSSTTTIFFRYEDQLSNSFPYVLKSLIFYDQELSQVNGQQKRSDFRDPIFELERPISLLPENWLYAQSLGLQASVASSSASRRIDKKSSLALKYQYQYPIRWFTFVQYQRITRSFFTKEITDGGNVNNPWSYRLANKIILPIGKNISLEAAFLYDLNRSFQGVLKDGISTDYKVKYNLEKLYVYAGFISVGVETKAADGSTDQLRFIDEKAPSSYIGIGSIF